MDTENQAAPGGSETQFDYSMVKATGGNKDMLAPGELDYSEQAPGAQPAATDELDTQAGEDGSAGFDGESFNKADIDDDAEAEGNAGEEKDADAYAELSGYIDKLQEMNEEDGIEADLSSALDGEVTPHKVEAYKMLVQLNEQKLEELRPALMKYAQDAELSPTAQVMLKGLLSDSPDDLSSPLGRDIIEIVIRHAYQNLKGK